jgi:hypothetical protein
MRDCNHAVKKVIPTPVATDNLDDGNAPDVTQISDDSSVDCLLFGRDLESEGGIWDNANNNDVSFAPDGGNQNVIPPNNKGIRVPVVGSPVNPGNEGLNPLPNNIPDPNLAPEGARHQYGKAKQYPPAIWQHGAGAKLERVSLSVIQQEYKKLNHDVFALTFGHQDMPPMVLQLSKECQRLNYKQYCQRIRKSGDMACMSLTLEKTFPTVTDL